MSELFPVAAPSPTSPATDAPPSAAPATRAALDELAGLAAGRRGIFGELRQAAGELWEWRELLRQLTGRELRVRYKQAAFGLAWALVLPTVVVLAGVVIRAAISQLTATRLDAAAVGALAVKALLWSFASSALGAATPSLTSNAGLLARVYFPREVLPLSAIAAQGADSVIAAGALALALPWLGGRPSPALLWLPLLATVLVLLVVAAGLVASAANLFFRDVKYLVQLAVTFGVFFTPVFFEPAAFGPRLRALLWLNPLAAVVEGARLAAIDGHDLARAIAAPAGGAPLWSPWLLVYSAAVGVVGVALATVAFRRVQPLFAERV